MLEAGCGVIKVKVIKVYSLITLPELDTFPFEQSCVDNPVLDCKLGWWCCFQWSWCHELTHRGKDAVNENYEEFGFKSFIPTPLLLRGA